ncbi:hypothetical protein I4U23_011159 [Adineta vaga]|nr:hypothetical protein I4U23_011159 [Adineta vaga]
MAFQRFIPFVTLLFIHLSCAKPIEFSDDNNVPSMETKNTHGNVYENTYFGISIEKPSGWYVMDLKQVKSLVVSSATSSMSSNKKVTTDLVPLFGFFAYPYGSNVSKINANIFGVGENVTNRMVIKNDCDILNYKKTGYPITSEQACEYVEINGIKYAQKMITLLYAETNIHQVQLGRSTQNGYVFAFALTYGDDDDNDKNQLMNTMSTIRFGKDSNFFVRK